MANDCRRCVHHRVREESADRQWVRWHECDARGGMANLKLFPFLCTTCAAFVAHNAVPPRAALPLFHGVPETRTPRRRSRRITEKPNER